MKSLQFLIKNTQNLIKNDKNNVQNPIILFKMHKEPPYNVNMVKHIKQRENLTNLIIISGEMSETFGIFSIVSPFSLS